MTHISFARPVVLAVALAVFAAGCGGNKSYRAGKRHMKRSEYAAAIQQLKIAESAAPDKAQIKRDLGIAYFKSGQYSIATGKLTEAYKMQPKDKRALLYLGFSYEERHDYEKAEKIYRACTGLKLSKSLRKELLSRIRDLTRQRLHAEIRRSVKEVRQGTLKQAARNTVAVLYFRNVSRWPELDPLIKGITEMITADLRKIRSLQVVERAKVNYLLAELKITVEELYDRVQAPKAGRMLGAGRLISGGIERVSDTRIRINAGLVETESGKLRGKGVGSTGGVSEVLILTKKVVVSLINDLGPRLTDVEYEALMQLPTQNIQAFIAFSKGLAFEDRRLLTQARRQYKSALQFDPKFTLAKERLDAIPEQRLTIPEMEELALLEPLYKTSEGT